MLLNTNKFGLLQVCCIKINILIKLLFDSL